MNPAKNNNYYHLPRTTIEQSVATTEEKTGDATVVDEIEAATKMWDDHIERLEAKLSFLIRSYDDPSTTLLLYQYEKKIATLKEEIGYAMEDRHRLNNLSQMSIISALR